MCSRVCAEILLKSEVETLQKEVTMLKDLGLGGELKQLLQDQAAMKPQRQTRTATESKTDDGVQGELPENANDDEAQGEHGEVDDGRSVLSAAKKSRKNKTVLHKATVGTRVKIETRRFDNPNDEVKFFEGKRKYTHGSIVKQKKNKVISVLWDGDLSAMDSHASHLEFAQEDDADAEPDQTENQSTVAMARILLTAMMKTEHIEDPHLYYFAQSLVITGGDLDSAQALEPYRSLAAVA